MTSATSPTTNWSAESRKLCAEQERRAQRKARAEVEAVEREQDRRAAERGRDSLALFLKAAWDVVEPGRPLLWGWHLEAICAHLEAVAAGTLTNLLITIPPGTTKSRTVAVFWPAWTWLRWPEARWLFLSNADDLASRDSMACRRLLESDWFRLHYPDAPRITTDQNTKTWYENDRAGHRQSLGIRANVTGKKGDLIVVDDANDAEKVEGAAERATINGRWDNAIYDRVIDFKKGRRVVVGQRTHKQDLIGHIQAAGGFEELRIPEEFELAKRCRTAIGYADPRKKEGDLLRPDQFGREQVEQAKRRLGTIGYRAKHQQEPADKEGYRFKRAWFRSWRLDGDFMVLDDRRGGVQRFNWRQRPRWGTADGAASARTSADFTCVCAWLPAPRNDLVWLSCRREQVEIPDQPALLQEEYRKHGMAWCGVEAVVSNVALYQHAKRTNMVIKRLDPEGKDKLARATPAIVFAESGRLWLPDEATARAIGFPLDAVLAELTAFTGDDKKDEHDDVCLVGDTVVATARGGVPIRNVVPGDRVMTRAGYRPVVAAARTSPGARVLRVALEDGTVLVGTPAHRVYVPDTGFVRLDSLAYGAKVAVWKPASKPSSSTAALTAGTPGRSGGSTGCTSSATTATRPRPGTCTATSGSTTTGRSRTIMRSTTTTATRSTTRSATCCASPSPSTGALMPPGGRTALLPPARTLTGSGPSQRPGTARPMAANGTAGTPRRRGRTAAPTPSSAGVAPDRSSRCSPTRCTARRNVWLRPAARPASTTKIGRVASAAPCSASTGTQRPRLALARVLAVSEAGVAEVFNLRVEGDHEYFANGVLTHNCDNLAYAVKCHTAGAGGGGKGPGHWQPKGRA